MDRGSPSRLCNIGRAGRKTGSTILPGHVIARLSRNVLPSQMPTSFIFYRHLSLAAALASFVSAGQARAEEPAPPAASLGAGDDLTAPSLKEHPDPPYPAQALTEKVEGNVG